MTTSSGSAQTAAERRAAESELQVLVARLAPSHGRLVSAVRSWVRKRLPTAHELAYEYSDCVVTSFTPSGRGFEGVLAVRASADGVRLCVSGGKDLPDPQKLLQGSGKQVRWMAVDGASTLRRPEVIALADAAIALAASPFPATGRGSVVVRPTAAKKRSAKSRA